MPSIYLIVNGDLSLPAAPRAFGSEPAARQRLVAEGWEVNAVCTGPDATWFRQPRHHAQELCALRIELEN